ncbi:MAG: RHS repeat protein [Candidatus Pacebacteria bacterium]|nr:RHS repeat protein [Candidatus Paceibacterota bacterium]
MVCTYEYDSLNRLVKVVFTNGETYEYTYDNLGNRTLLTVVTEIEQTYVPDDNFEQELQFRI